MHKNDLFQENKILMFSFSCKNDRPVNPHLFGTWDGVEWLRKGQPIGQDASQVHFTFKTDGTFEAAFGNQKEAGKFDLDGDKLYIIAEGQLKKMVKIRTLTADTLSFQMNRTGTDEVMVLIKK